jgi:lipopolysaccharide transport system ATP-binding protein
MGTRVAVRAERIGKEYRIGQFRGGYKLLTETLGERVRHPLRRIERGKTQAFWALRDIGFEVAAGETFGIIGHNGAGKSTLLKILSRVTPPTTGEIRLRGRVGALLEVGTGFHSELTGRENIFLNGAVLGMRRTEIQRRFDEIVEFAEVGQFVDTPVKRYSSGMYLRLAFAVAAHLEPEVLIVDEVLSVGDLAFQEKCLGRMERVAGEGRTVLFVSHNLAAVQKLCPRAMLLSRGEKVIEGPTSEVVDEYVRSVRSDTGMRLADRADRDGSGRIRFDDIWFETGGRRVDAPVTGQDLDIVLRYTARDGAGIRDAEFAIGVYTQMGEVIMHLASETAGIVFASLPPEGQIRCRVPRLPLPAGRYAINLFCRTGFEVSDWVQRAADFTVAEGDFFGSGRRPSEGHQTVLVEHLWLGPEHEEAVPRVLGDAVRADVAEPRLRQR